MHKKSGGGLIWTSQCLYATWLLPWTAQQQHQKKSCSTCRNSIRSRRRQKRRKRKTRSKKKFTKFNRIYIIYATKFSNSKARYSTAAAELFLVSTQMEVVLFSIMTFSNTILQK